MPRAGAKVVVVLPEAALPEALAALPVDWVDDVLAAGGEPIASLCRRALDAGADVVVTLAAAGGAVDPMLIPRLVGPLLEGRADLVLGARAGIPLRQRLPARALGALAGARVGDLRTGYRACRRGVLEELGAGGRPAELPLRALRGGLRVLEVPAREGRRP